MHRTRSRLRNAFDTVIAEARAFYVVSKEKKLNICTSDNNTMVFYSTTRTARSCNWVVLPEVIKHGILNDCRDFLAREGFYAERGLLYRRDYLLHSFPGSGNSTTNKWPILFFLGGQHAYPVAGLATKLGLDAYIIRLNPKPRSLYHLSDDLH